MKIDCLSSHLPRCALTLSLLYLSSCFYPISLLFLLSHLLLLSSLSSSFCFTLANFISPSLNPPNSPQVNNTYNSTSQIKPGSSGDSNRQ